MRGESQAAAGNRIDEIVALLRSRRSAAAEAKRTPTDPTLEAFVREYYRQVDPEDLAARSTADLYGAALSHWQFAHRRDAGAARLRVHNPSVEEHGWQCPHTVVEIVTDDMSFLVDSVTMAVNRCGLTLHLFVHPIVSVRRDAAGQLQGLAAEPSADAAVTATQTAAPVAATGAGAKAATGGVRRESFMHVEVDRTVDAAQLEALSTEVSRALADVRVAVEDWQAMRTKARDVLAELDRRAPPIPPEELAEGRAFLAWLAENHFTFLGYRCHDLVKVDGAEGLKAVAGSGLGLLRETDGERMSASFAALPPKVRERARVKELLVLTKANSRSTVHRPGALDYVGVKRFDERGEVCGEHRFFGLYTSVAYMAKAEEIPLLRRKVATVTARAGVEPQSHAGKALANILNTYPRDELLQIADDELYETAIGILQLGERQRFRLFVRRDPFERFLSCLIYVPRENYTTELRLKWQRMLTEAFDGTGADFHVFLSESVLARILIVVRTRPGAVPEYDVRELERRLAAAARRWEDDLKDALVAACGEARGSAFFRTWSTAFPAAYREDVQARAAVSDVEMMAGLAPERPLAMRLYRPVEAPPGTLRFRLLRRGGPVTLSDSLPMLERMGLRVTEERPYRVQPEAGEPVWIHDFTVLATGEADIEIEAIHAIFEDAFARVWRGESESDDFNRLVLGARLAADEVQVLRAYARYLRQAGFGLSQTFVEQTLAAHPEVARMLVNLFRLRLDPEGADDTVAARQEKAIETHLDHVTNLSEDRVLRHLLALVLATTRTNFWRRDAEGRPRGFLSFKLDPAKVPGLPEPRPMFEIYVYATRFEGVHLRGGKVARGGLRWSDRHEDFRTEVLGLMKAQMVKNTVIVPVGSKGGFVLKRAPSPADRDAYLAEGVACYKDYLRGLLDLTDNLVAGKVVPPPQVRRRDGDDPYLVVAADKGTASFSDYANSVSKEYGFWLGDAFASGGSAGYDHKKMGITARGAWVSAQRHFREMGIDVQATAFTVVGIGDMSGDVFGNGLLRSPHAKLLAAFDHRHVFLDPDPDPAGSFVERQRLFELPRSSWADYDEKLISAGGGVWPRSAKSIPISPQARAALGIDRESLPPNELVSAILRAPVDLLYNGGIGTYVKSAAESHAEAGDRANDAVRVDGRELRCKVVVEGGNLGFTQRGRIEFALAGGRIFTDAIDNSGGVDTSDHEVNIKILVGLAIADGELTEKQRNVLLAGMTDEVATLVLRDNYFQTQSLAMGGRVAAKLLDAQQRFVRYLEKAGKLNRAIEFLPADEAFEERRAAGAGLASPERAVLLAYSKIWLYDELLASNLPDDAWVATALARYFPRALGERFGSYLPRHPLRREIIATHVTNSTVNRVGSTFVHTLTESTGAKPAEVVRAYLLQREVFDYVPVWQQIEALDNVVPDRVQGDMLVELGRLTVRATTWFLRSKRLGDDMARSIEHFRPGVEEVAASLASLLDEPARAALDARLAALTREGVPEALARRVAASEALFAALDIVEVAEARGQPVGTVAGVHFGLGALLELPWLRERIGQLPAESHWQALAKAAMRDDLAGLQRGLVSDVLARGEAGADPQAQVGAWQAANRPALERARHLLGELRGVPNPDVSMLSVALRELRNLG
jgi:glutamate dehydrogenase